MENIFVINGPNLNMLDQRDKDIYGDSSIAKIEENCQKNATKLDINVEFFQSNFEGEIIEVIQNSIKKFDGIIINAAAYTHTSVAIRDALELFKKPKVEIHISNIFRREEFRKHSLISDVVDAVISGFGDSGYEIALSGINNIINKSK